MNTHKLSLLLAFLICFAALACEDDPIVPTERPPALDLAKVRNVPWILTGAQLGDSLVDLGRHFPFELVISDTMILGYDGCNHYTCRYSVTPESLALTPYSLTAIGCNPQKQFDLELLAGRWKVASTDTSFSLTRNDTVFGISSAFTRPVGSYAFTAKRWKAHTSNDTSFALLDSLDLLPVLEFTGNREYTLRWYPPGDSVSFKYTRTGFYGIASGNRLTLKEYWPPEAPPVNSGGRGNFFDVAAGISRSTSFAYTDTLLTLSGNQAGTFYTFKAVQ